MIETAAFRRPSGTAPAPEPVPRRPAGIVRRALALVVDLAVVGGLVRVGMLLALGLAPWEPIARAFLVAYLLVVPAAYFVLLHGLTGQTLGKRLLGARVVTAEGAPLGFPRALIRQAAWLASVPLGIGYLVAAVRADRRALHDLLAGTRVARVR